MRDLKATDYSYLELLNSELSIPEFESQFTKYSKNNNYFIKVIEKDNKIIAAGSLLIKPRFLKSMKYSGWITNVYGEDKFIKEIVNKLIENGKEMDCYLLDIILPNNSKSNADSLNLNNTNLKPFYASTWNEREVYDDKTRLLEIDDYEKDFLDVMRNMYHVKDIQKKEFITHYQEYDKIKDYFIFIKELEGKIRATGSIYIYDDFFSLKRKGILEDIIVDHDYRLQNFSKLIIEELNLIAKKNNCYQFVGKIRKNKMDYCMNVFPTTEILDLDHYIKFLKLK
ncbi:hypothetical protein CPAV1605_201 [seawater metagenome]|uniref:N-acetyltransferase domain-containing protein n=1 Tax=seawater metagenome TaxID=1561972 RepID=A0A5E8CIM1_9ZZZZ